jgi:cell division protein FtsI/penicillin-binding protein 2
MIVIFVCAAFFLIALRLFILQVLNHEKYKNLSLNQQENFFKNSFPKRGDIFLTRKDGQYSTAASTKKGFLTYLNNRILEDPKEAFSKLSSLINIDEEVFFKLSQKKDDPFEILQRKLTEGEAEKILASGIKGIGISEDEWRFYPFGSFLSHVLGFSSVISEIPEGRYGTEKFYNVLLSGGKERSFASYFLGEQKDGQDIILTIEPSVQAIAEKEIESAFLKWQAKSGGILVLNPKNGKVIAMAGFPEFDPNKYFEEENLSVFLNPFTEKIFEMGSVLKPITMAIAIDSGNITPDTTYIDNGFVEINGAKLRNFDEKPRGKRTMTQVLEESLNTGAVFAMQSAGKKIFQEYLIKFGFYEKTNIDLPGEVRGNLSNLESGRGVEFATASFGQGIALSPIATARALGVLANDGMLLEPTLREDKERNEKTTKIRQVIKKETAFLVSKMLVDVVDHTLAGGKAKINGYSIAAKTGTAQIPDLKIGGYSEEFLHSFFGYFPAYDPQFLIFIFLEQPIGAKYSSQTLTDPFTNITKFLINYYTILPDR